jgi:hypothetical protein
MIQPLPHAANNSKQQCSANLFSQYTSQLLKNNLNNQFPRAERQSLDHLSLRSAAFRFGATTRIIERKRDARRNGLRPDVLIQTFTRKMSAYKTPIKNLYLTGILTHPGGGVFAASGHNTAQLVLSDKRTEYQLVSSICVQSEIFFPARVKQNQKEYPYLLYGFYQSVFNHS